MRRAFGKLINQLSNKDKKIILIVGDIGYGILMNLEKNHPTRFFNMRL